LGITRIFPGLWLKQHPARMSISIIERTSWSCHHGILRWVGDCRCVPTSGSWKTYLRSACDRLADEVDEIYSAEAKLLGMDPWKLRNQYIHVLLRELDVDDLLTEIAGRPLRTQDIQRMTLLLEAQHQRQRMFTSCGWYYEDFSRIEPKNCLAYAAQAVALVRKAVRNDLTPLIRDTLSHVYSHRTGLRGDFIFSQQLARAQ
jgi:hypothetical protein